jgi:acyl-CoA synthetase (AMP-forming)/AMP-acid ligase II
LTRKLCELIDQTFAHYQHQTALIQHHPNGDSNRYSFKALKTMVSQVNGLLGDGLNTDDCIGLYMQRSVEQVASIVACIYTDALYSTINHLVSARQVVHIAQASNMKVLICDNSTLLKLRALTQDEAGEKVLTDLRILHIQPGETLPPVHAQTIALLAQLTSVQSIKLSEVEPCDLSIPKTDSIDKAKLILFTSGSTGTPKGVMIKGGDLIDRINSESTAYGLKESDVLLNLLPFSFDVGCNQLYTALVKGCCLVILNSWMPKDMVSAITHYKVTGISGVPSLWLSIINSNLETLTDIGGNLRYITISGGDMAEKDRLKLRHLLPDVNIFKTYGQTETFRSGMLLAEHFDEKQRSVGRPVQGVQIYIVDEDGNQVKPGEIGEIIHHGVGSMLGYIGDAKATNVKLKKLPDGLSDVSEEVIYTGDLGWLDEDGFLYLHGRKDRMFKVRGNRVYPEEIEKELCDHQEIEEAVSAYDKAKDLITVFVRKSEGTELSQKDVVKYLAARLPSYMMPGQCLLYKDFPRTGSGKVDMPTLIAQA